MKIAMMQCFCISHGTKIINLKRTLVFQNSPPCDLCMHDPNGWLVPLHARVSPSFILATYVELLGCKPVNVHSHMCARGFCQSGWASPIGRDTWGEDDIKVFKDCLHNLQQVCNSHVVLQSLTMDWGGMTVHHFETA